MKLMTMIMAKDNRNNRERERERRREKKIWCWQCMHWNSWNDIKWALSIGEPFASLATPVCSPQGLLPGHLEDFCIEVLGVPALQADEARVMCIPMTVDDWWLYFLVMPQCLWLVWLWQVLTRFQLFYFCLSFEWQLLPDAVWPDRSFGETSPRRNTCLWSGVGTGWRFFLDVTGWNSSFIAVNKIFNILLNTYIYIQEPKFV